MGHGYYYLILLAEWKGFKGSAVFVGSNRFLLFSSFIAVLLAICVVFLGLHTPIRS